MNLETAVCASFLSLKEIAKTIVKGRASRTGDFSEDYYQDHWAQIDVSSYTEDIVSKLAGREGRSKRIRYHNALQRYDLRQYYLFRYAEFQEILSSYGIEDVVEFGCGYGKMLAALWDGGNVKNLAGVELTSTGAAKADEWLARLGAAHEIHQADLRNLSGLDFRGRVGYTYHCLEQLNHHTNTVLKNIAATGVELVVHFEPTTDMLGWSPVDIPARIYSWRVDYQSNLLTTIRTMETRGECEIIEARMLHHCPSPVHHTSLIVWRPIR